MLPVPLNSKFPCLLSGIENVIYCNELYARPNWIGYTLTLYIIHQSYFFVYIPWKMFSQWWTRNRRGNSSVRTTWTLPYRVSPVYLDPCVSPRLPTNTLPHRVPTPFLLDVSRFSSDYPAVFLFLYADVPLFIIPCCPHIVLTPPLH